MRALVFLAVMTSCAVDLTETADDPPTSEQLQELSGDNWSTALDDPGGVQYRGIAISPVTHNAIAAGTTTSGGWKLMRSTNGTSWSQVDPGFGANINASNVAVAINGYFYAIGYTGFHAVVRRSTNDGVSWSTVFDATTYTNVEFFGITTDIHSTVFVSGVTLSTIAGTSTVRGVVWRGSDPGTWHEVHAYTGLFANDFVALNGMCTGSYHAGAAIFAVGQTLGAATDPGNHTTVHVSTDGGSTWSVALDHEYRADSVGTGCTSLPGGDHLLISGFATDLVGGSSYEVIDMDTLGATWTETGVYTPNQPHTRANGVLHLNTRSYVLGTTWGTDNGNWRVRFKADSGGSWLDSENWHRTGASNDETIAYGAAFDASLGLLVAGTAEDSSGVHHGIIRHRDSINSP